MLQKQEPKSFLERLYPNTKLWISLAITLAVSLVAYYPLAIVILIVSPILIYKEGYLLEFKVVLFAIIVMALSMFLINGTLNPVNDYTKDPVFIIPILNWKLYSEGLAYGTKTFLRIAPLMGALFLLFRSMNMTDLGIALNEGGLSYRASFIFITTFQTLPLLMRDMNQISDAQKSRGLDAEGSLIKRFKAFIPIMVPVVSNSIMKVQDQAMALETKGFNSDAPKTIYRTLEKRPIDNILKYISILISVLSVTYWIWSKFIR